MNGPLFLLPYLPSPVSILNRERKKKGGWGGLADMVNYKILQAWGYAGSSGGHFLPKALVIMEASS